MSDASEARRVVVTGGSSGIGLATALRFVADGATVVSLDLAAPPDDDPIRWFATDVSDDASVRAGVAAAVDTLGGLDVLVNNAGIGAQGTVEDNSAPVAEGPGCQRLGDRPGQPGRPTRAPAFASGLHRQHLLDRRDGGVAAARSLQRQQGCRARSHPRDGRGPHRRGHPGQLCESRYSRHPVGGPATGRRGGPGGRACRAGGPAADGAAGHHRRGGRRIQYLASPAAGSTTGTDLAVDGGMSGLRMRPRS
jgi:2-keto-3-deoxy-L-fuconate dehydrogenase